MSTAEPAREKLRQAMDSLRTDIDRVEFWADALDRLSQHLLPSQHRLVGQH